MNWVRSFNPLRNGSCAWVVPLTWAIIKCAAVATPVTIEVFLHHRFGLRTGKTLLKGLLLMFFVAAALTHAYAPPAVPLLEGFVLAYVIAAVCQWLGSVSDGGEVHSYLTGEPWPAWRRVPLATTTIQRYVEPLFCYLIGGTLFLLDPRLGHWICVAAIALFVKGQILRFHIRAGQLDALDSRFEAEQLAPRTRTENEAFVEARPAPPRRRRRPPGVGPHIRPH